MLINNQWAHWRNKKIPGDKRKLKHNDPKSMGHSKNNSKREVCRKIQAYLRKEEKSQINNLTLYLKELEKEEQNSKLVLGNKAWRLEKKKKNRV